MINNILLIQGEFLWKKNQTVYFAKGSTLYGIICMINNIMLIQGELLWKKK